MDASQIHTLQAAEVFRSLGSQPGGLTTTEAAERLRQHGANRIGVAVRGRLTRMLLKDSTNFFSLLLYISAAMCLVADSMQPGESMRVLGAALFGVAILNGLFAFAQQYRAERAMEDHARCPRTNRMTDLAPRRSRFDCRPENEKKVQDFRRPAPSELMSG